MSREIEVHTPNPHPVQQRILDSPVKRKIVRAGRRGGKTVGLGILAVEKFLDGKRVLYAAPTSDQIQRFWTTVTRALGPAIDAGVFYKNETHHTIELQGTEQRIRAKTAWNADTLRGDYADELILDEYQLMSEDAWEVVGAPMLLDNNGNVTFIYTPPSLNSRSVTKARDPQHAAKLYKKAKEDKTGRWETFHFSSHDNPHISVEALRDLTNDMTDLAIRQEIYAEDIDEPPGALWTRSTIADNREKVLSADEVAQKCDSIIVAIDPSSDEFGAGDAAGIMVVGRQWRTEIIEGKSERVPHLYVLEDCTMNGSPAAWAKTATQAAHKWGADYIVAESNNGGEMVRLTIKGIDSTFDVKLVHASRGKAVRAQPISARYEKGYGHHVGSFPMLEDELCLWRPGDKSPNRLDALVWGASALMLKPVTIPPQRPSAAQPRVTADSFA